MSVRGVTPFLWFDSQAEEAARFYVSLIRGSRILEIGPKFDPEGTGHPRTSTVTFQLAGQKFIALNGGPEFRHSMAFSIYVDCATQSVVDRLWTRLLRGGKEVACGWLQDRYGVAWQIIPTRLPELLSDPDPERASRALAAMMKMKKIVIRKLELAADGK